AVRAQFLNHTVLLLPCSPSFSLCLPCSVFVSQMDTEKNGAGKCSFSVVRVCAKILVSSARDAAERDEEKADADLAQGMKELSLLGEKKDVSARVGCVSKTNLSEARAEILYWLFVMAGNHGYLPEDLFEDLGIYI
ncbi:unnamed protein product, partial [Urochloa humidicola]